MTEWDDAMRDAMHAGEKMLADGGWIGYHPVAAAAGAVVERLEERDRGICERDDYGRTWVVVPGRTPEEAAAAAASYWRGEHPSQRQMAEKARAYRRGLIPSLEEREAAATPEEAEELLNRQRSWEVVQSFREAILDGRMGEWRATLERMLDDIEVWGEPRVAEDMRSLVRETGWGEGFEQLDPDRFRPSS